MNYSNKCELENLSPIDFCNFLCSTFCNSGFNKFSIKNSFKLSFNFNKTNFEKYLCENKEFSNNLKLYKFNEYLEIKCFNKFSNKDLGKILQILKNYIIFKWFEAYEFGEYKLEDIFRQYINLKTYLFYK